MIKIFAKIFLVLKWLLSIIFDYFIFIYNQVANILMYSQTDNSKCNYISCTW